jgi:RNA polymerase sigma-70 factor (ECF subfamily)
LLDAETELKTLFLSGLVGDTGAHKAFLVKAAPLLRSFLRARLRADAEEAEDLLQETLIAILTKRDTYDPAYPISAWIYAIARYRLIDHLRRQKRRGPHIPIDFAEDVFETPEDEAVDAKRDVGRLLELLPQKQRDAIRLVKLEGVSVRDAAARTGLSESDIKVSAHRGLKALAQMMAKGDA